MTLFLIFDNSLLGNALSELEDKEIVQKKRKKVMGERKRWTLQEEKEIKNIFKFFFNGTVKSTCPSQHQCQEAISLSKKNGGIIWKRPRDNIKRKVNGMLLSKFRSS